MEGLSPAFGRMNIGASRRGGGFQTSPPLHSVGGGGRKELPFDCNDAVKLEVVRKWV